jgi:imidazole glycerol-phosphate synthase subunit HisH
MEVAIIRYNAGNIQSVEFALGRLGVKTLVTSDPEKIKRADKVLFPGVGEASTTMEYLNKTGMADCIRALQQPVLGICLGLQLMCRHSEEGNTPCLGIFDEQIVRFSPNQSGEIKLKVPHMGWNGLSKLTGPLWKNLPGIPYTYFVHSFYATQGEHTIATCHYGLDFSAALHKGNFYATQFHPEKSGKIGAQILENFIKL